MLGAVFLADDAVLGKGLRMRARMACSAARSAAVTGSKPPVFLLSTARAVRKNGKMVSPEAPARWSTKLAKSMAVIAACLSHDPPRGTSYYRKIMRWGISAGAAQHF